MRRLLIVVFALFPTLAPLAQASPEALQSIVVIRAAEAQHEGATLPPEAVQALHSDILPGNVLLTALSATGAYILGGAVGYSVVASIAEDQDDDLGISEAGFYGIAVGGTIASSVAAHIASAPSDPLWRTLAVPLATQLAVIGMAHAFLRTQNGTVLIGAPPVAIVLSTSIALWD